MSSRCSRPRALFALLTLLLVSRAAMAQLYSVTAAPTVNVILLDPETGATHVVAVGRTDSVYYPRTQVSASDPLEGRFFFVHGTPEHPELATFRAVGSSLSSVTLRSPFSGSHIWYYLAYDAARREVLGNLGGTGSFIARINSDSGAINTGSGYSAPNFAESYPALRTFDWRRRRLFWFSNAHSLHTQRLMTLHLATGAISAVDASSEYLYVFLEYDPVSEAVLALTSAPGLPLVTIDPLTGSTRMLTHVNADRDLLPGLSALDAVGRRFFFITGAVGAQQLVTVNLVTLETTTVSISSPYPYEVLQYVTAIRLIPINSAYTLGAMVLAFAVLGVLALKTSTN